MRKLVHVAAALVALVATSYAVAHGIEGAKTAKAVTGGFDATAANTSSRTCTTADGKTLVVTDGKYTGQATGDPTLTGPITLRARSVINTTDDVGVVQGRFRIDVSASRDTEAAFAAVYDHGNLGGLAAGKVHGTDARLLANLSSGFTAGKEFKGAKLGGTSGGSAVELGPGSCRPAQPNAEHSEARGTISQLTANLITVAGLTCAIPPDKSADVNAKFKNGDRVAIRCAFTGGQNTLTRIERRS